ncbi:MAG TPA: dihydrofolate reductase family protein [Chryseosolibacter sp.]
MKTIYFTATSLDGYIAGPNHSLDWLFQFGSEDPSYYEFIKDVGAVVMGSSTYEWILKHDTFADPKKPKPWPYRQPAWIFTSRSRKTIAGADIRFVNGDVRPVFEQMREAAKGKNIWVVGGGHLAAQFHEHGLLDEMIITFAPVFLAGGAPLFTASIIKPPLRVISVKPYPEGFVQMRLQVQKGAAV